MEDQKYESMTVQCPFAVICNPVEMADRVAKLEARMTMGAENLAGFAAQHQRLHWELTRTMEKQGELVQKLVNAARGVGGTDWDSLFGEEIPATKRLTKRVWKIIAAGLTVIATVGGAMQYVRATDAEQAPSHYEGRK